MVYWIYQVKMRKILLTNQSHYILHGFVLCVKKQSAQLTQILPYYFVKDHVNVHFIIPALD